MKKSSHKENPSPIPNSREKAIISMIKGEPLGSANASPPHSIVTPQIVEALEDLFQFVPPRRLRERILSVFMLYLTHEHGTLPMNFQEVATDYHFLFQFLEQADDELTNNAKM